MKLNSLKGLREALAQAEQRGNAELAAMLRRKIAQRQTELATRRLERAAARFCRVKGPEP